MNILGMLNSAVVWLAMGGELFDPNWSTGNMEANPVTSFIHNVGTVVAVSVISIIGFGIVVSSIVKNSAAGLYCANPHFWDKVATAKTRKIEEGMKSAFTKEWSGNRIMAVGGSIETVLLSLFPNVKSYTDFSGGQALDPKGYFMKAIPAMVVVVFMGVLIFYG